MLIWLASYPRSGNTFFRSVLKHYFGLQSYSIYGDHFDIGSNEELSELVGHAEGDGRTLDLDELRRSPEVHIVKTHDIPCEYMATDDRVIHITRDGRDASASYLRYQHRIGGHSATSLQDVLMGRVMFGFWGNHVIRWSQAKFDQIDFFKFEEITSNPDRLADRLSEIFDQDRSREPFPAFEDFKQAAPNFFGAGKSGVYGESFSEIDLALFDLYSGPALRIAGYVPGELLSSEVAAYSAFCSSVSTDHCSGNPAGLRHDVEQLKEQLADEKTRADALQSSLDNVRQAHRALEDRHARLRRYTGVELYRKIFPR
jgi:Sulfotransferase domain